MRVPFAAIGLLTLSMLFVNCEFEGEKTNFNTIDPPTLEGISIDLNESNDTLYVFTSARIGYKFDVGNPNRRIKEVLLTIDGQKNYLELSNSYFTLNPREFRSGFYSLKVEFTSNSGTGSLADQLGAEQINVWREWIVEIDNSVPAAPSNLTIQEHEGKLKIEWNRCMGRNFQEYRVSACYFTSENTTSCLYRVISDADSTTIIDSVYCNGKVRYSVQVVASDHCSIETKASFEHYFNPDLKMQWVGHNAVKFAWAKPPKFAEAVKEYSLILDPSNATPLEIKFTNLSDTTYSFTDTSLPLGTRIGAAIIIKPKHLSNAHNIRSHLYQPLGYPSHQYERLNISYNANQNRYYFIFNEYLESVDGTTGEVLKLVEGVESFTISISAQFAFKVYDWASGVQVNTATLDDIGARRYSPPSAFNLKATNNGLVLFGKKIMKISSGATIREAGPSIKQFEISDDGDYLLEDRTLWAINDMVFTSLGTIPGTDVPLKAAFDPVDKGNLVTLFDDRVDIIDLSSFTVIKTIPLGVSTLYYTFTYDPLSQKVGIASRTGNEYLILDTKGNDPLRKVKIFNIDPIDLNYAIVNGQIICSTGVAVPLSSIP